MTECSFDAIAEDIRYGRPVETREALSAVLAADRWLLSLHGALCGLIASGQCSAATVASIAFLARALDQSRTGALDGWVPREKWPGGDWFKANATHLTPEIDATVRRDAHEARLRETAVQVAMMAQAIQESTEATKQ